MSLTRKERVDIAVLAGNRRSQREIADEFNKLYPGRKPISPTTVGSILAEFEETGAIYSKSRRLPGKARNSEQQAVSDFVDSKSSVDDVMRTQVGSRHVSSEIDEYLEEGLLDMPEQRLTGASGFDLTQSPTSSAFPLSPLFTVIKEEPEEAPFFKVLYATDLLGTASADDEEDQPTASFVTADVDDEEDQPPDSFVTSNERNLLKEYFEKNFRCVPFNWTAPSSLITYSKPEIPGNQAEQSKEDYATCKLCGKTIQTSRFTNLSNHARRHAEAKKYRCAHCTFQHYEPFKIRRHMALAHGDKISDVVDNVSSETKEIWDCLLQKCFPSHAIRSGSKVRSHTSKQKRHTEENPTSNIVTERLAPYSHEESSSLSSELGSAADVKSESCVKVNQVQSSLKSACNSDEDTSSEQASEVTADEGEKSDPDLEECRLCNKAVVLTQLKNVVEHAKEHYVLKQFECSLCGFANDNQLHVKRHAVTQHPNELPRIVEHNDENMNKEWAKVARICFPSLPE